MEMGDRYLGGHCWFHQSCLSFLGSLGCAWKDAHWAHRFLGFRSQSNMYVAQYFLSVIGTMGLKQGIDCLPKANENHTTSEAGSLNLPPRRIKHCTQFYEGKSPPLIKNL